VKCQKDAMLDDLSKNDHHSILIFTIQEDKENYKKRLKCYTVRIIPNFIAKVTGEIPPLTYKCLLAFLVWSSRFKKK
jgi:hypothetical protein